MNRDAGYGQAPACELLTKDQGRRSAWLGGGDQTHRRRARISGFEPDDRHRPPFGKRWPRRQDGQR